MYSIWCDYYIGEDEVVFTSTTAAKKWAIQALSSCGVAETFDQLWLDGSIGVETLEVIDEKGYV